MGQKDALAIIPAERIQHCIYLLRGEKVILSHDLAELYGVETRALVQAVQRNIERFPTDFMFQLDEDEFENLKSQIVTSSWGGRPDLTLLTTISRAGPSCFPRQFPSLPQELTPNPFSSFPLELDVILNLLV